VEECTYFWGVNTSWGIDTAKSKGPLHQEDNQAPQPTKTTGQHKKIKAHKIILELTLTKDDENLVEKKV
jgi:hypothetical protein